MSSTEQDSKNSSMGISSAAAWRRRQEASSEVLAASDDGEQPVNGYSLPDHQVVGPTDDEQQANGYSLPHHAHGTSSDGEVNRANRLHTNGHIALNGSAGSGYQKFAEKQQAALNAMISFARPEPSAQPLPVVKPDAPELEQQASLPGSAVDVTLGQALAVIDQPQIIEEPEPPDTVTPDRAPATGRAPLSSAQRRPNRIDVWFRHATEIQWLPLTIILVVQAALSLRLVWTNTAFSDEALYLWSGRLEWDHWLHGTPIHNFPDYFSGAPVVYPPLGAMAASLGGLYGARILSLCFMLLATVLLHGVTRRIYDRRSANFAAALFAGLGVTQFLGAFATYDAMALMLLGTATWLCVRSAESRPAAQVPLIVGAASALALADAAKYAATLFNPVVIIVAGLVAWRSKGRKHGVVTVLALLCILALLLFIAIRIGGPSYWQGINSSTLTRAHGVSSPVGIIADSFGWAFLVVSLALIGCGVAMVRQNRLPAKLCAFALAGAVALAPANQARIRVFTSLFKHVGFGAWFAAAVAGYALASLADAVPMVKKQKALTVSACTAAAGILVGTLLAQTHFASWPNTTALVAQMRTILPDHRGNILSADNGNVIEYYLENDLEGMQFYGTRFFHYQDPSTGKYLINRSAYADAVRHRFFSVIVLSFSDTRTTDEAIERDIRTYGGYTLIATLPYRVSGSASAFRIWVHEDSR